MKVHVLHIFGPLRPSGMEKMLVTAGGYFRQERIQGTVLGQGDDHPFATDLQGSGFNVKISAYRVGSPRGALALKNLVRELDVDVIHIHTEGDYLRTALASWWAMGCRPKVVRTIHNVFAASGTWRLKRLLQAQLGDRLVHALVAPSPEVANHERSYFRGVDVIYNWVDDVFFNIRENRKKSAESRQDRTTAVIVGNCSRIKNHEMALRALIETNHELVHLGNEDDVSDDERQLLRLLEKDGRLADRGVRSPEVALSKGSYFLMPSRHEGMGVALAEALVAGLPCFVNDAPGLRWAKQMDGVEMLPEDEGAWASALKRWSNGRMSASNVALDFSAARGAREYSSVYKAAARRGMGRKR